MSTQNEKWNVIRLEASVRSKLEIQKKSKSYSVYINDMLLYFDALNISPESFSTHPSIEIKKDIERVIKIIRAIEKDKINPILENSRRWSEVSNPVPDEEPGKNRLREVETLLSVINQESDESLTLEDFLRFIEESKKAREDLAQLQNEVQHSQRLQVVSSLPSEDQPVDSKQILELIEHIEGQMTQKGDHFTVERNVFTSYMERIKSELKNVRKGA